MTRRIAKVLTGALRRAGINDCPKASRSWVDLFFLMLVHLWFLQRAARLEFVIKVADVAANQPCPSIARAKMCFDADHVRVAQVGCT